MEDNILNNVYLDNLMDKYLTNREKDILEKRFGLDNKGSMYYKDIADDIGLSDCTVSNIANKAINKLKDNLIIKKDNTNILKKYYLKDIVKELYDKNFNDIDIDDREKNILIPLFNLDHSGHLNMKEICEKLGISSYSFTLFYNRVMQKIENYIIMKEENKQNLVRKP